MERKNRGECISNMHSPQLFLSLSCKYLWFSRFVTHFIACSVPSGQNLKHKMWWIYMFECILQKIFEASILLSICLYFVAHYILAPEAVSELDYELSYGNDNMIKIIINWMVSSLFKSFSCQNYFSFEFSSASPFINTTSCNRVQCLSQCKWNGADEWDQWHRLCLRNFISKFVCLSSRCCQRFGYRERKQCY